MVMILQDNIITPNNNRYEQPDDFSSKARKLLKPSINVDEQQNDPMTSLKHSNRKDERSSDILFMRHVI